MNTPELLDPAAVAAQLIGAPASSAAAPAVSDQATPPPAASQSDRAASVTPASNPFPGVVDKKGRPFDPLRHKVKNGAPFINADGYFMPIGGRKPLSAATAAPVSAPAVSAPPPALAAPAAPAWSEAEKAAAAKPAAEVLAPGSAPAPAADAAPAVDYSTDAGKAITHGVCLLAGVVLNAREEVKPSKPEAEHLIGATAAWIRSTGWQGGPLAGALLAWFAYFIGIADKPKVSAKLAKWLAWFSSEPKPQAAIDVVATAVSPSAPKPAPAATGFAESAG